MQYLRTLSEIDLEWRDSHFLLVTRLAETRLGLPGTDGLDEIEAEIDAAYEAAQASGFFEGGESEPLPYAGYEEWSREVEAALDSLFT